MKIYRVLKPNGIAFFRENSDQNAILRFFRRLVFGKPGEYQRQKLLFMKRRGTIDEYPLREEDVEILSKIFKGGIERFNEEVCFFWLIDYLIFGNPKLEKLLSSLDSFVADIFPFVRKYSFLQEKNTFLRRGN